MNIKNMKAEFQYIGNSITNLQVSNTFISMPEENTEELKKNVDVDYVVEDIEVENGRRLGFLTLRVKINVTDLDKNQTKFSMDIRGCFSSPLDVDEEMFKNMISLNGCTTLYSIARANILAISSQIYSGGKLHLPMLNMYKVRAEKESADGIK